MNGSSDCLQLTFEELCHIRSVLTKAELDYLLFDSRLFYDVSKGKICFSCRKTRFNIFIWGYTCRICKQRVCKRCLRNVSRISKKFFLLKMNLRLLYILKARLSNAIIAQVPLDKLCPSKFSNNKQFKRDHSNSDTNSNGSSSNDNDSELSLDSPDDNKSELNFSYSK